MASLRVTTTIRLAGKSVSELLGSAVPVIWEKKWKYLPLLTLTVILIPTPVIGLTAILLESLRRDIGKRTYLNETGNHHATQETRVEKKAPAKPGRRETGRQQGKP